MSLRQTILTDEEVSTLDAIYERIYEIRDDNRDLRLFIRRCIKDFIFPTRIEDDELSKLMKEPSKFLKRKFTLFAAAYDFAAGPMARLIGESNSADSATKAFIKLRLEDIEFLRKTRLGGDDNLDADVNSQLDLQAYAQPISQRFLGNFFGYRRSATLDEIVRFTMKITQVTGKNKIRYTNEYTRGGTHWRVHGTGYCVRDTLYLFGHALSVVNPGDREESLGLRFLALRELPNTRCLNGLVISMAGDGMPISARVVLVPMEMHRLSAESEAEKKENRNQWELDMIQHPPTYDEDITSQIGHVFDTRKVNYFLELIRNNTNSVLTGRPAEDATLAEREESIRRHGKIMDGNLDLILSTRYRKFLEGTLQELDNLPKGG